MIRRLVGIAHVADMDRIEDPDTRAACEQRALRFGRRWVGVSWSGRDSTPPGGFGPSKGNVWAPVGCGTGRGMSESALYGL